MEKFYIIALAGTTAWFAWNYFRYRRSIEKITADLRTDSLLSPREATPENYPPPVQALSSIALNTVAEAVLGRNSEQRQRAFLEALLNEIKDAIFIVDRNEEIRFLNEAAKLLFPSDQPYIARSFLDVCRDHRIYDTMRLASEIRSKVSENIVLKIQGREINRIRERNLLIEAEPLSLHGSEDDSGSWILMRDITSELETEQIRRDFLANASHELRTPLSILNGYLETMDDAEVDLNQESFRRAIRTMRKHGNRIARIVEDMLTISKLENASELLNNEPFDLRESLNEMVSQLMPLIEQNHARVKVRAEARETWIFTGDRFYWDQIFFNLIENALKQNREPGLNIEIEFSPSNGRIIITVKDDGIGIPSSDLPLVFKRFYRVQKHHANNAIKGTGLGLSIVKRAVEAHRGEVSVDSIPGVSTIFTITIPESCLAAAPTSARRDSA